MVSCNIKVIIYNGQGGMTGYIGSDHQWSGDRALDLGQDLTELQWLANWGYI